MLSARVDNFLTQDSSPGLVLLETITITGRKTGRREKSLGGRCYQTMSTKDPEDSVHSDMETLTSESHSGVLTKTRKIGTRSLVSSLFWGLPLARKPLHHSPKRKSTSAKWTFFFFFFLPHRAACGILVPGSGIELSLAVRAPSPNYWTSRELPGWAFKMEENWGKWNLWMNAVHVRSKW